MIEFSDHPLLLRIGGDIRKMIWHETEGMDLTMDRIKIEIRGRGERKDCHFGSSRNGGRPYDRKSEGIWRERLEGRCKIGVERKI